MEQRNLDLERRNGNRLAINPELATAASLLAQDVPNFLREGVTLAKLEAKKTVQDAGMRVGVLSVAAYLGMVGFFFLCVGLSFLISEAAERAWLGPLVVGGGLMLIGAIAAPIALKAGRG